jgi:hypothetical protein
MRIAAANAGFLDLFATARGESMPDKSVAVGDVDMRGAGLSFHPA